MVARRKTNEKADLTTPAEKPEGDLTHALSNSWGALLSYVERYERLTEEIDGLGDDRKEVVGEAKATGFDTKTLRKVLARRKMDPAVRQESDALVELYEEAIRNAEKAQLAKSEEAAT